MLSLAGFVGLLLVGALVVELWLVPHAARRLEHELAVRGFHISYRDPDLALFRGSLLLRDITLHEDATKKAPLLFLSELGLKVDLSELIWKQALWGEGSVSDGKAIIYGELRDTVFESFNAEFDIDLSRLRIAELRGDSSFGYELLMTGEIRWDDPMAVEVTPPHPASRSPLATPSHLPPSSDAPAYPDFPGSFNWAEQIASRFGCTPFGTVKPRVALELIWDETRPAQSHDDGSPIQLHQLTISGSLEGSNFVWQNFAIDQLAGRFHLEHSQVEIDPLEIQALGGAMTANGNYDLNTDVLTFSGVESTVDPITLLDALDPEAAAAFSQIEYRQPTEAPKREPINRLPRSGRQRTYHRVRHAWRVPLSRFQGHIGARLRLRLAHL